MLSIIHKSNILMSLNNPFVSINIKSSYTSKSLLNNNDNNNNNNNNNNKNNEISLSRYMSLSPKRFVNIRYLK